MIMVKILAGIALGHIQARKHSRKRSNVFGNARFWFLPKPNQILPKFYSIYLNLPKYYPNLPKNLLRDVAASPALTSLLEVMADRVVWKFKLKLQMSIFIFSHAIHGGIMEAFAMS